MLRPPHYNIFADIVFAYKPLTSMSQRANFRDQEHAGRRSRSAKAALIKKVSAS
jgi:hypothetical protein